MDLPGCLGLFQLLDAEKEFLNRAYQIGDSGRLVDPEQIYYTRAQKRAAKPDSPRCSC
jgi:hypothetical protein